MKASLKGLKELFSTPPQKPVTNAELIAWQKADKASLEAFREEVGAAYPETTVV